MGERRRRTLRWIVAGAALLLVAAVAVAVARDAGHEADGDERLIAALDPSSPAAARRASPVRRARTFVRAFAGGVELRWRCFRVDGRMVPSMAGPRCDVPIPVVDWTAVAADPATACASAGGAIRRFSNGCADACIPGAHPTCTMGIVERCDCGDGRCWIGDEDGVKGTCIDEPAWHGRL